MSLTSSKVGFTQNCFVVKPLVCASRGCASVFLKDWFNAKQTRKQMVVVGFFLTISGWCTRDGTAILCTSIWFLKWLGRVCVEPISNAILWTHFVTPRGYQAQQDQTDQISYCKKGKEPRKSWIGNSVLA